MDQSILLKSLEKQVDQAEGMLNTFVVIALIAYFAGVQGADPIKAAGFEIPRATGSFVFGLAFVFANVVMLLIFLRIGDLLTVIEESSLLAALTTLGTHKWLFNPFSYFGSGYGSRIRSSGGLGLCITIWWIGFAARDSLISWHSPHFWIEQTLSATYVAVGFLSMLAVNRVYSVVIKRCEQAKFDLLLQEIKATRTPRALLTFLGIAVGGSISLLTGAFQRLFEVN